MAKFESKFDIGDEVLFPNPSKDNDVFKDEIKEVVFDGTSVFYKSAFTNCYFKEHQIKPLPKDIYVVVSDMECEDDIQACGKFLVWETTQKESSKEQALERIKNPGNMYQNPRIAKLVFED